MHSAINIVGAGSGARVGTAGMRCHGGSLIGEAFCNVHKIREYRQSPTYRRPVTETMTIRDGAASRERRPRPGDGRSIGSLCSRPIASDAAAATAIPLEFSCRAQPSQTSGMAETQERNQGLGDAQAGSPALAQLRHSKGHDRLPIVQARDPPHRSAVGHQGHVGRSERPGDRPSRVRSIRARRSMGGKAWRPKCRCSSPIGKGPFT